MPPTNPETLTASCPPKKCAEQPESSPEPTPLLTEKQSDVHIPGTPGFWCSEFRTGPDEPEYLSACYRVKDTCESARNNANKKGATTAPCQSKDEAHCFIMANTAKQAIFWRCYSSEQQCMTRHERLQVKHAGLQFSDCSVIGQAPSRSKPPTSVAQTHHIIDSL